MIGMAKIRNNVSQIDRAVRNPEKKSRIRGFRSTTIDISVPTIPKRATISNKMPST